MGTLREMQWTALEIEHFFTGLHKGNLRHLARENQYNMFIGLG